MSGCYRDESIGLAPRHGRHFRCGFGFSERKRPRRGFCQRFGYERDEKEALLKEKSWLEKRLNMVKERLSTLA